MQVQPYLFFNGRCEEAAEFYRRALGAEVTMLMRLKDRPEPQQPGMVPPGSENKVMHMRFRIGDTDDAGFRRPVCWAAELSGLCAVADGCPTRPRPSASSPP